MRRVEIEGPLSDRAVFWYRDRERYIGCFLFHLCLHGNERIHHHRHRHYRFASARIVLGPLQLRYRTLLASSYAGNGCKSPAAAHKDQPVSRAAIHSPAAVNSLVTLHQEPMTAASPRIGDEIPRLVLEVRECS